MSAEVISEILLNFACIPLSGAVILHDWKLSPFGNLTAANQTVKDGIKLAEGRMERFLIEEWWSHLKFADARFNINATYMPEVEASVMLHKWMEYQWGRKWKQNCKTFKRVSIFYKHLKRVFLYSLTVNFFKKILSNKNGKSGCGHVWGDTGSGKTWVMRGMVETMMKPGIYTPDKGIFAFDGNLYKKRFIKRYTLNMFLSSDLKNARVLFIDGVPIKAEHHGTFLEIMAGQRVSIEVMHAPLYFTQRMGVIICSNHRNTFPMDEQRWRDRIVEFEVRKLEGPEWENVSFRERIHPMAWIHLWDSLDAEG